MFKTLSFCFMLLKATLKSPGATNPVFKGHFKFLFVLKYRVSKKKLMPFIFKLGVNLLLEFVCSHMYSQVSLGYSVPNRISPTAIQVTHILFFIHIGYGIHPLLQLPIIQNPITNRKSPCLDLTHVLRFGHLLHNSLQRFPATCEVTGGLCLQ